MLDAILNGSSFIKLKYNIGARAQHRGTPNVVWVNVDNFPIVFYLV